jgi:hypothetical protein
MRAPQCAKRLTAFTRPSEKPGPRVKDTRNARQNQVASAGMINDKLSRDAVIIAVSRSECLAPLNSWLKGMQPARAWGNKESKSEPILGVSGCDRYKCRMKFCALVVTAVFCATSLFAEETPESIARSELPSLLTIYKDVHQHPELSTHEQRSSELILHNSASACLMVE